MRATILGGVRYGFDDLKTPLAKATSGDELFGVGAKALAGAPKGKWRPMTTPG